MLPHWPRVGVGTSQAVINANANLGPGEGQQTDQSWAQMQTAESQILDAAQNGVPNDPNEQGKLAFGIAMGVAAYAAPPFAALMAGLYALAQAIAPELYNIGLLVPPHCTQTGPAAQISDWPTPNSTTSPGIPAVLWAGVVDQITKQANCGPYIPSALLYQSFAGIWNNAHAPTVNVALAVVPYGGPVPMDGLLEAIPYFGVPWDESLWRYTNLSMNDQLTIRYLKQQGHLVELDFNNGPLLPGHGSATSPTTSPSTPSASGEYHGVLTSTSAPSGLSTGAKVAVGASVVGGGALIASALYAAAKKEALSEVWSELLKRAKFW